MGGGAKRSVARLIDLLLVFGLIAAVLVVVQASTTEAASAGVGCTAPKERDPRTGRCKIVIKEPKRPGKKKEPQVGDEDWQVRYQQGCHGRSDRQCVDLVCNIEDGYDWYTEWSRRIRYDGQRWEPISDWTAKGVCRKVNDAPSAEQVWTALVDFGIEGGKTEIQPPNGRTLVEFKTNFYTTRRGNEFELPVGPATVLIRYRPARFDWDFGDGTPVKTTTTPGHPYPKIDVTHEYSKLGTFHPSVTIHYAVEWQYSGQWHPFGETLEAKTSPKTEITVVESQSELGD